MANQPEVDENDYYLLLKEIKRGLFGRVHLAWHKLAKKMIAVKIADDGNARMVLRHEYFVYNQLRGVVGIPYVGDLMHLHSGCFALPMELLGQDVNSLAAIIDSGFSREAVCRIGIQAVKILEAVHSRGVVHCDIKPFNFLIGRCYQNRCRHLYLIDFGSSKTREAQLNREDSELEEMARCVSRISNMASAPKDDLESVLCILAFLLKPASSWEQENLPKILTRATVVEKFKQQFRWSGLNDEFLSIRNHLLELSGNEKPNYQLIMETLANSFTNENPRDVTLLWDNYEWHKKEHSKYSKLTKSFD